MFSDLCSDNFEEILKFGGSDLYRSLCALDHETRDKVCTIEKEYIDSVQVEMLYDYNNLVYTKKDCPIERRIKLPEMKVSYKYSTVSQDSYDNIPYFMRGGICYSVSMLMPNMFFDVEDEYEGEDIWEDLQD